MWVSAATCSGSPRHRCSRATASFRSWRMPCWQLASGSTMPPRSSAAITPACSQRRSVRPRASAAAPCRMSRILLGLLWDFIAFSARACGTITIYRGCDFALLERAPVPLRSGLPVTTNVLKLNHDLAFEDLYHREGLARVDAAFAGWLASADADLHNRLVTARRDPDALEPKAHSQLLTDLAPHLEDFVAGLFGVEAEARALQ